MRDVNSLPGLHKLRTMFSVKKRSIPRIQSSTYLDLYMLNKEKERLLKEDERLCRRKDAIKKRMEEIDLEMNKPQEVPQGRIKDSGNISLSENAFTQGNGVKKEWKKMPLSY